MGGWNPVADIGRAVQAVAAPVVSTVSAVGDIAKGDLGTAGKKIAGSAAQVLNPVAQASNMSGAVEGVLNTNDFTNSWSQGGKAMQSLQAGQDLSSSEVNSLTSMYGKEALIAGTVTGGVLGTEAINAGKSGLGFLKEGAATAGAVKAFSKDPVAAVGSYLGVDVGEIRDRVDEIDGIRSIIDGITSQPANNRAPSSTVTVQAPSQSMTPMYLLFGAGLIAMFFVVKSLAKKGRK